MKPFAGTVCRKNEPGFSFVCGSVFTSVCGRFQMVFDGTVFNAVTLRNELKNSDGCVFETEDDAEMLLALYRKYGRNMLEKLNGSFTLAVFDTQMQELFLARDRFGIEPLFYHVSREYFAFSNTLSELKKQPFFDRSALRLEVIPEFLALQYIPREKTIYDHTFKLLPGHSLTFCVRENEFELHRYYSLSFAPQKIAYADACVRLQQLLADAVMLRAEHAQDLFLSGGLDSALVGSLLGDRIGRITSVSFRDPVYDESALARETADFLSHRAGREMEHHFLPMNDAAETVDTLKHLLTIAGEPFADSSLIPFSRLCAFAQHDALCGDGADEFFLGYERLRAMKLARKIAFLPFKDLIRNMFCGNGNGERSHKGRLARLLKIATLPEHERYFAIISHNAPEMFKTLFDGEMKTIADRMSITAGDPVRFDISTYLPGDTLTKAYLGAAVGGIRTMSPFLDHRVAEFAVSLPQQYRQNGAQRKKILGDAFCDRLPPGLPQRKKRGFGVPLADWLRGPWHDPVQEYAVRGLPPDLFRRDVIADFVREHNSGAADHSYLIYSLLNLALFLEINH